MLFTWGTKMDNYPIRTHNDSAGVATRKAVAKESEEKALVISNLKQLRPLLSEAFH